MPYYQKKANLICFDPGELELLYRNDALKDIFTEIAKRKWKIEELYKDIQGDKSKMHSVLNSLAQEDTNGTEIFIAQYCLSEFYGGAKICFPLINSITRRQLSGINTLEKLKKILKKDAIIDFAFISEDGLREFQLKAYKGSNTIEDLFEFIKSKLQHYGNSIGHVNFLINLQKGGEINGNFFHDIHHRMKNLDIKGTGHILLMYNENNKYMVINTIYPILGTTRINRKIQGM